jgi:hypothetical protein
MSDNQGRPGPNSRGPGKGAPPRTPNWASKQRNDRPKTAAQRASEANQRQQHALNANGPLPGDLAAPRRREPDGE